MPVSLQKDLILLGIGSLTIAVSLVIRRKVATLFKEETTDEDQYDHKTFFTTKRNAGCREDLRAKTSCFRRDCSWNLLTLLCNYLSSAEDTISLCMYTASIDTVFQELYAAHMRGVCVRIITDFEMTRLNSSIFHAFRGTAVLVKNQGLEKNNMMHHKFCLIDEYHPKHCKMFFGSMNLTFLGLSGNFEHVTFTTNKHLVNKFAEEFEYLWQQF